MSDWALCVGIGAYNAASGLEALPGVLNDTKAIYDWLVDPQGGAVLPKQAKLILSPAEQVDNNPVPLEHEIDGFLRQIYRESEQRRRNGETRFRRLWLYYAGHGIGFPNDDHDVGLLTADAQPPFRDFPHVAGKAWAEVFRVTKAFEELVLIMDCCRIETNRTALRKPAVRTFLADPAGKMMAAFAVSPSRAAYEVVSADGVHRGRLTLALEDLLRHPTKTPMTAREFLDQLERRVPDIDPFPPNSIATDFVLLSAREVADEHASLLIAHGETTADLASDLSSAMGSQSRRAKVRWAPDVMSELNPDEFLSVRELVVTRDLSQQELKDLIYRVQPKRTVVYGQHDPGVANLERVRFVPIPDGSKFDLDEVVLQLDAALSESPGFLEVICSEVLAKIRIWNEDGRTVAQGFGGLEKRELPPGTYLIRAALGPFYVDEEAQVVSDQTNMVELPALPLRLPSPDSLVLSDVVDSGNNNDRSIYKVHVGDSTLSLSAPIVPGWRFEAFTLLPEQFADVSFRLVPESHPLGAPHPMDRMRESLKLALAERSWDARKLTVDSVQSDPLCAVLAAAIRLKNALPHEQFVDAAAAYLNDHDPDIELLRGPATIEAPPLLSFLWHFRIRRQELVVASESLADGIVDNLQLTEPWLTWSEDSAASDKAWFNEVANTLWPGWNDHPDAELALRNISDASQSLGGPADSIRRNLRYKSPPLDLLVRHQEIAFVGASNDQLPAALAVAFVERKKRKWKRLDFWSLTDHHLRLVNSLDRDENDLLEARDRSEKLILELMKVVAEEWSLSRYEKLEIQYKTEDGNEPVWCFASLWDWKNRGGYIHVSPYKPGDNVRITDFEDLVWRNESKPEVYRAVAEAYTRLRPSKVLAVSQF